MTPRASTMHPLSYVSWSTKDPSIEEHDSPDEDADATTVSIGGPEAGTLLRTSLGTVSSERRSRVLVVEDNDVLRMLL